MPQMLQKGLELKTFDGVFDIVDADFIPKPSIELTKK